MIEMQLNPAVKGFRCSLTQTFYPVSSFTKPVALCTCCDRPGKPLVVEYDLSSISSHHGDQPGIWKYAPLLPVHTNFAGFGADVGLTPTLPVQAVGEQMDIDFFAKYERNNPSGSFKDRGLSVGIALGVAMGAKRFCLPTQGNAGVAAALFSARLNLPNALIYMPTAHQGSAYHRRAMAFGAEVRFFGSTLAESGKKMRQDLAQELDNGEYVDISTFFEPGRLEGKKTMGLEIFDFFNESLPDWIIYPTGGGTGLVGIWKALTELQAIGQISEDTKLPKLVAVQSANCSPVVNAYKNKCDTVEPVITQGTMADGLNVPGAIMGHGILQALKASGGCAIAVEEKSIKAHFTRLNSLGIPASFESAATVAAIETLTQEKTITPGARVLSLFTSGVLTSIDYRSGE